MKRLFCALLAALLLFPVIGSAMAEIDLSAMSYDELKALRTQVGKAIDAKEIELGLRPDDLLEEFTDIGKRFENDTLSAFCFGGFASPKDEETGKRIVCMFLIIENTSDSVITIDTGTGLLNSFTVYVDGYKVETDPSLTKYFEEKYSASLSGELHPGKGTDGVIAFYAPYDFTDLDIYITPRFSSNYVCVETSVDRSLYASSEEQPEASDPKEEYESVAFLPASVRNDATGLWRICTISESIQPQDYALYYFNKYFADDRETHFIVNFKYKTTTIISKVFGSLDVRVLEYVSGEEHDAKILGSGMLLTEYYIDITTGECEKIY